MRPARAPQNGAARDGAAIRPVIAPAEAASRATNLRRDPTEFFGRDADLAAIHALFEGPARLATLTGVAGIGKTRAAREYALRHLDSYPGGAWFCELSTARDLEHACHSLARALGLPPLIADPAGDVPAQLGQALSQRGRVLLVLDNFEQLVAHADAVRSLLEAAPEARLLVTSQELLRLPAEYAYELRPLSLPASDAAAPESAAVQLFLDRARHVRHDLALGDAERALLCEIVRGLEGIPLALELAAARMTALGLEELRALLSRRFDLLARRGRGPDERHGALRSAIDWSWELLSRWERLALAQCAVFRAGFSLAAAERVLALPDEPARPTVLELVQALREKSLLTAREVPAAGGALRFGCFESIREYADARLDELPGARAQASARHAEYYLAAAIEWGGDPARVPQLGLERENLLAAVDWALAHVNDPSQARREPGTLALSALVAFARVAFMHSPPRVCAAQLDAALAHAPPLGDAALRARAFRVAAEYRWYAGDLDESVAHARAGLSCARADGDAALEGELLNALGLSQLSSGRLTAAGEAFTQALALHERNGDVAREAVTLSSLSQLHLLQGRHADSIACLERSLARYRALGDRDGEARAVIGLGWNAAACGHLEEARARVEQARAIARPENVTLATWTLYLESEIAADREDYGAALEALERHVASARRYGQRRAEITNRGYRGIVLLQDGRVDLARAELEWSCRAAVGQRFRALFLAFLAGVDAVQGRLEEAQAKLDEADAGFAGGEDMLGAAAHVQRALVALCLAARDDARGAHAQARARREEARGRIDGAVTPAPGATLPPAALLYEVRAALRVLERAHGASALDARAQRFAHLCRARERAASLRLHAGGAWFELREGPRVSCERRQVLRRLLVALGEHRVRAPGEALSAAALIAAGWPGERILHAAARNRLKFSVALLRRLGLRDAIQSQGAGYLIDPALALEWAE